VPLNTKHSEFALRVERLAENRFGKWVFEEGRHRNGVSESQKVT
jgi:hypothetical protein